MSEVKFKVGDKVMVEGVIIDARPHGECQFHIRLPENSGFGVWVGASDMKPISSSAAPAAPSDRIAAAERRVIAAAKKFCSLPCDEPGSAPISPKDRLARMLADVELMKAVDALLSAHEPTADEMAEGIVKQHVRVISDRDRGVVFTLDSPKSLEVDIAAALVDASGGKMKRRGK